MEIAIQFNPHRVQWEVMRDPHRFKTIVAGRRTGKTTLAWNLLVYYALKINEAKLWYVAPTYKMAKDIVWEEMKRSIPKELVYSTNETALMVTFFNGSVIKLNGADNPDSLRGSGLHGVVLDEYQDFDKDAFSLVIRPALSDFKGFAYFIGTPKGEAGPLYEVYVKDKDVHNPEYKDENGNSISTHPEYKSFKFKTLDNPYISEEEIEAARESMTEEHFKQEYEADFVTYTGLIFKEFSEKLHCREIIKSEINKNNIYVGIDTGEFTAVEFCAYSGEGVWRAFDEIYAVGQTTKDICDLIKKRLMEWNLDVSKVTFIIDSASQHKREYIAQGIYVVDCNKDMLAQIDIMRELFKGGKVIINNGLCVNLSSQLKGYQWDTRKTKYGRMPKKINDHTVDAFRYVLGSAFISKPYDKSKDIVAAGKTIEDINTIADRLGGVLSDDFERYEDENMLDYRGGVTKVNVSNGDPVTGY